MGRWKSAISDRIILWWKLVFHGWWRPVMILVGGIGLYDLIIGQFMPSWPTVTELISNYFPVFNWRIWIFILMALAILAVLEGSYRKISGLQRSLQLSEKEREPCLIVENDTSECNHKLGYSWRLKVKNIGIDTAENCRGQLVEFADEVPDPNLGWQRWPKNEFLSWANGDMVVRIQAKQTMELEILYGGGYQQYLYLAYASGDDFRQEYAPKSLRGNIVLIIMITQDGRLPIYAVCLFHKWWAWAQLNALELKAITSERPDIALYQRPNSHKEDSQT